MSRSQSALPLKERIDTNYSTPTRLPRLEVKQEVEQDSVERAHTARTGKEMKHYECDTYCCLPWKGKLMS